MFVIRTFQNGFDSLQHLIPELSDTNTVKISKAQMLECSKSSFLPPVIPINSR